MKTYTYTGHLLQMEINHLTTSVTPTATPDEVKRWENAVQVEIEEDSRVEGAGRWEGYHLVQSIVRLVYADGTLDEFVVVVQGSEDLQEDVHLAEWGWGEYRVWRGSELDTANQFWEESLQLMDSLVPPIVHHDAYNKEQ